MTNNRTQLLARTPFEVPDLPLYQELRHETELAFCDLGHDRAKAQAVWTVLASGKNEGVRLHPESEVAVCDRSLGGIRRVLLAQWDETIARRWSEKTEVYAEVRSLGEAERARECGVSAVVLRGAEADGLVGSLSAFILFQSLVETLDLPCYVDGGIGPDTAAGLIWSGAAGVVLSEHFALLPCAGTPASIRSVLPKIGGSDTRVVNGFRGLHHPLFASHRLDAKEWSQLPVGPNPDTKRCPASQSIEQSVRLAEQFSTVHAVCSHFYSRIAARGLGDQWMDSLGEGSPLAMGLGTRYPLAQGPMTRVSDRAAFAKAVSDGGAMPFLALSLMRSAQARELLIETKEQVGDGPWGVGILGFAPPEIREAHLKLIEEFRPSTVLIAGGRPSQARALEEQGITVFLHVPSATLLELFLKEGARNFVFEGRECGGHVGPQHSLSLWQSQLDLLRNHQDCKDTRLVFAGGIHDGRGAALISAMTADVVAQGAQVGALMGSAYLFTEEATATGAIGSFFQQAVIDCADTALLETAPGHATRCVRTGYVEAFEDEKRRLQEAKNDKKVIWEQLETLNVGRLRIATKGIERKGDDLISVSPERQREEGMVMVGQVAALRSTKTTISELHESVCNGASAILKATAAHLTLDTSDAEDADGIAVIGMSCIFPGAEDLESYWTTILEGKDTITEVPRQRWNPDTYFDPNGTPGETTPSKWGGFLKPVPFDPMDFGIPPKSLSAIEPVQLLSLLVSKRALKHAGYEKRSFNRERTSVIFGAEAGTDLAGGYGFRAMYPQLLGELPEGVDAVLPNLTEDSFPGVLANVIAGRIANRLDLGGVNYTVDAACASSLTALELAVKELETGTSDMVLCGGADLHNSINDYLMFSSVHALSKKGRCMPFDSGADGIALGEGIATVVLKRVADARRDGDTIHAIINGVSGASDGKSLGLTAPRKEGQVRALNRAYERAGVNPVEVGMVEAHGTGTVVGDRTELSTLESVYDGAESGSVVLGSVKSQIGHTKCAAGLAGLLKGVLAVQRGLQLPTLHIREPNPGWSAESSPFVFLEKARPWVADSRKVGVSAFGFGGTNFHAVVSSNSERVEERMAEWPAELLLMRGETKEKVKALALEALTWLERGGEAPLRNLAYELLCRGQGPVAVACVASDMDEARAFFEAVAGDRTSDGMAWAGESTGELAFLMSGQGSQRVRMVDDWFLAFPELRDLLDAGKEYLPAWFPPQSFTPEEAKLQRVAITDTRVAQPTLGLADLAAHRLYAMVGIHPDMAGGHSYGEWAALAAAGAITAEQLVRISANRAASILDSCGEDPGTMASVKGAADEVAAALGAIEGVVVANLNAPNQTVISGTTEGIAKAIEVLESNGLRCRTFPVACAFHSPVLGQADTVFAASLEDESMESPRFPVYSNVTAAPHVGDTAEMKTRMAEHLLSPVRFVEQIEAMYAAGARTFVECGPGRIQTNLVSQILGERPHQTIAAEVPGENAVTSWLRSLVECVRIGSVPHTDFLFQGRSCSRIDTWEGVEPIGLAPTLWWVNGQMAWPESGQLPPIAMKPMPEEPMKPVSPPSSSPRDDRAGVVLEFLGSMREVIQAQRDVVLGYLGTEAGAVIVERTPASTTAVLSAGEEAPGIEALAENPEVEIPARTIGEILLELVSDRTGYPAEMIGMDMDLEGDLSIDSIKRIEILGGLSEEMGWANSDELDRDAMVEELASLKSLREMIEWLETQGRQMEGGNAQASAEREDGPSGEPHLSRYVMEPIALEEPVRNGATLAGQGLWVRGPEGPWRQAVEQALVGEGARLVSPDQGVPDEVDGVVQLHGGEGSEDATEVFSAVKDSLGQGAKWIVSAAYADSSAPHGGSSESIGMSGMIRAIRKEFPNTRSVRVQMDGSLGVGESAATLVNEILDGERRTEVTYADGKRWGLHAVEQALPTNGLELPAGAVILATGGARGITARTLLSLAQAGPCTFVVCGRSPWPEQEEPGFETCETLSDVRKAWIAAHPGQTPREVEAACLRLWKQREMRATRAAIEEAGSRWVYTSLDVRSEAEVTQLVRDTYEEFGAIYGVVHGAGVIEDRKVEDKDLDSFRRVYDTKVVPARVFARELRPDVSFVTYFSSVSGAFGNPGQVDYSSANAALDNLAAQLDHRIEGRAFSINWGPWGGGGMVSPALERIYREKGIGLISPEAGVNAFIAEVAAADGGPQAVWMCADPEAFS